MNAHALARKLLSGKDLPVIVNGWGSDEGSSFQVSDVSPPGTASFNGTFDTAKTRRSEMGYVSPRKCLVLQYSCRTPPSAKQLRRERARKRRMELDRKRLSPEAFSVRYAEIKPLTPQELESLAVIDGRTERK